MSRGFGDSCAERWGTLTQKHKSVLTASIHPHQALCPLKIDHLSHPSRLSCPGEPETSPKFRAAGFPPAEMFSLFSCPSSLPQVRFWSGFHGVMPTGEWRDVCSQQERVSFATSKPPFLASNVHPQRTVPGPPTCWGSQ